MDDYLRNVWNQRKLLAQKDSVCTLFTFFNLINFMLEMITSKNIQKINK